MILSALHRLPNLGILALIVVAVTGVAMAAPWFGRRAFGLSSNKEREDAASSGYKAIMSMTGVVLAFSLVQADGVLRDLETVVAKEAAAISSSDRILLRSGAPELIALRPALAAYARSLIEGEWPLLAKGERNAASDDAYAIVSKAVRSFTPTDGRQQAMYSELLKNLDDVADLREEVLAASDVGLPAFFWTTVLGLLALGFALALLSSATLAGVVGLAAPATAVALILAFVVIVDRPFEGETSLGANAIEKTLKVIGRRV